MNSYKKSEKTSSYARKQQEFLETLRDKGFRNARIIQEGVYPKRREDRELLIVK